MDTFFSIIIPTYNRGQILKQTIPFILNQTYRNFELIIVDDGSSDDTREILPEIIRANPGSRIQYHYKVNGERGAARNYGLQRANGDYVNYFDSDDEMYPDHLEKAAGLIEKYKSPACFHQRYHIKHADGSVTSGPEFYSPPNKRLINGNFLSCNGVFVRKDIALTNLFNEDRKLSGLEDWELWLRICAKHPLHYSNNITTAIINHDQRSVLEGDKQKLVKRIETFIEVTSSNPGLKEYYHQMHKLEASALSYLSLHLALTKKYRKESLIYLFKSLRIRPGFVFKRRFLAILKHLL
jgi:glycosyltransferase involved in cell wall biosynthesis